MNPIAAVVAISGEDAMLRAPPKTKAYDPGSATDYKPGVPENTPLRGVPETKIEHVVGATGGFTFEATSKPVGLKQQGSTLFWRDEVWTVLRYRQRTWLGQINGYTLYLAN